MQLNLERVIGHRGACGYAPENTISSLTKAYEVGAKWIEFDVMLSKDGVAIVFHDFTLERTTNGQGEVSNTDFEKIKQLDSGRWFSELYEGAKVPTLKEYLQHAAHLDLQLNIEIKPQPGREELTAQKTLDISASTWPRDKEVPLLSSFSTRVLATLAESDLKFPIGYVIDDWHSNWKQIVERYQCTSLHVDHQLLTPARVREIKKTSRYLLAYTVNDPSRAKELFGWGVDSVFSDYPDVILAQI